MITLYVIAWKNNNVEQKALNKNMHGMFWFLLWILIGTDVYYFACMNICRIHYVKTGEPVQVFSNSELLKKKYTTQRLYNFNELKTFSGMS